VAGNGVVSNGVLSVLGNLSPGVGGIGSLTLDVGAAAPGGTLLVDVAPDGNSDVLIAAGNLDLSGTALNVADTMQLNTHKEYTVATFTGTLAGPFASTNLTGPWFVLYDHAGKTVKLSAKNGTLIRVK
jgi:hypothetical protein